MNEALAFSIECKREVIAFDLCRLTRERGSQLTIGEVEMQRLIRGEMHNLIKTLVKSNCLLSVDAADLDVDELFQAQQIQDRAQRDAEEGADEASAPGAKGQPAIQVDGTNTPNPQNKGHGRSGSPGRGDSFGYEGGADDYQQDLDGGDAADGSPGRRSS